MEATIYEPIIMLIPLVWWHHQSKKIFACVNAECFCLSMSLVAHTKGGFYLFHLLGVVSGTFQTLLAWYDLFRAVPLFTSHKVTECFDLQIYYKSTYADFITKERNRCYEVGQLVMHVIKWGRYYKTGQLLLQTGAIITKAVQYRRQLRQT